MRTLAMWLEYCGAGLRLFTAAGQGLVGMADWDKIVADEEWEND